MGEVEKAVDALERTRDLVSEAAMTGFNPHSGDWVDRLYANNGDLTACIKALQVQPCDCERGHNGLGISGRECDCGPEAEWAALADRLDDHVTSRGGAVLRNGAWVMMQEAASAIRALIGMVRDKDRSVAALESLRPHWAQGYSSDSLAAQSSSAALSQIWTELGVDNQTDAMEVLRARGAALHGDAKEIADRLRRVEGGARRLCLDAAMMIEHTEARATAAEARVAELERDLEFVSKWVWREDPPHATSLLAAEERLDVIKYYPSIKAIWGFSK